ncbi:MAG: glycosyltransferase family 9 protein [Candidatus Omnitrophica bacterium]|nr:glycosyltransferase family 9 protein [Candidatus Omnitrophota bacterium]
MEIKNILAVRNDRLGEFLLNIPAFRALKTSFPGSKLILAVDPYLGELAKSIGFVDEVIPWENRKHKISEILAFAGDLRKRKIDACVIFNPSAEFNLISFLSATPVRAGYARKWPFLLTKKIADKKYLAIKHEVEYNLDLAGMIGAKTEDKNIFLEITGNLPPDLSAKLSPGKSRGLVAVHPWTSDPVKEWPQEHFHELIQGLLKNNFKVIIVGGKQERNKDQKFIGDSADIVNLTGETTLPQLAAVLKRCKLLISADSGPVHLAAAIGTRVIAIFRNDLPGKTAKRWGPWGQGHKVMEKNNLSGITAREVIDNALRALES